MSKQIWRLLASGATHASSVSLAASCSTQLLQTSADSAACSRHLRSTNLPRPPQSCLQTAACQTMPQLRALSASASASGWLARLRTQTQLMRRPAEPQTSSLQVAQHGLPSDLQPYSGAAMLQQAASSEHRHVGS